MKFLKKSLGQNFLIDKNIAKKILNLTNLKSKNIIEIGPGKGALTDEILKKNPKSLYLLEKDNELSSFLKTKYSTSKKIKIINSDVLKFDLNKIQKKNLIVLGNLPYNISSQILVKILKNLKSRDKYSELIFMFQKELGDKIIAKYPSKNYGRLSIITALFLKKINSFLVSSNCFFPKPKVTSMVIHFKIIKKNKYNIRNINNLEKVTNILFSQRRKMIRKNIFKIIKAKQIKKIPRLNLDMRPENISPEIYYKITEYYEEG